MVKSKDGKLVEREDFIGEYVFEEDDEEDEYRDYI